uniref:Homeobox protein slou-like n=1 Tax=Nicotiana tabacum TaxID=4097 RepID=A0A1S4CWD0_TOBAC|nr:PREDICTED: homeobox protein slou-like [Nicotiana tabacum]
MEYDYRNRTGSPYDTQLPPMYGRPATGAPHPHPHPHPHPMYGQQAPGLYPRVGQPSGGGRNPPIHHTSSPSSNTGIGIRVAIKPEYRITPPPPLSTQVGDIPRSTFNFDFDFEKKILAEAEKESQNWSRLGLENLPSRLPEQTNTGSTGDSVINKYTSFGFNREAVAIAVANYGDNPIKVKEFAERYTRLKEEMGFSPNSVADALLLNDNDTDKAISHLIGNSS